MRIRLIAVGTKMPTWVETGFLEYSKRLPRELSLELLEIPVAKRSKNYNAEQMKQQEGDKILSVIGAGEGVIALDVKGKNWSTEKLSDNMQGWLQEGRHYNLLVGGPDGLDQRCLQRADQTWSLSNLTLPHPLVRVILAEQIYRSWSFLKGHPYHRG